MVAEAVLLVRSLLPIPNTCRYKIIQASHNVRFVPYEQASCGSLLILSAKIRKEYDFRTVTDFSRIRY